ncbi:jg2577 [Pararge aegeria aegeria]|uniref:Jg2577 protein n=1 Tax=Pararge aegeria aegeria TaxID=348720 RepID=A0A8S4QYY4_9NEOP|nr:jg2577 [Pararge aegeria aegeria]
MITKHPEKPAYKKLAEFNSIVLKEANETCLDYDYDNMINELRNVSWASEGAPHFKPQRTPGTLTEAPQPTHASLTHTCTPNALNARKALNALRARNALNTRNALNPRTHSTLATHAHDWS